MNRIAMSSAAAALLRALTERAHVARDRTLLTDAESVDWRSLTFTDERHVSADRRRRLAKRAPQFGKRVRQGLRRIGRGGWRSLG